jgi:hypothetical protein
MGFLSGCRTLCVQFFEFEPGLDVNSLKAVRVFKPAGDRVAIVGVEFDAIAAPPSLFRGDQRRPASGEGVKDNAPTLGAIKDRVGDQRQWLNRRVHGKFGIPIVAKAARASIVPNIGAVATETA